MSSNWRNILLRNVGHSSLFLICDKNNIIKFIAQHLLILIPLFITGCSFKPPVKKEERHYTNQTVWKQSNPRINKFVQVYSKNNHVKSCLNRASSKRYLNYIHKVFYKHKLPPELVHLPILESCFDTKAKSVTGARGMWQFTRSTGEEYGLSVGFLSDDRLNWRKATHSAARYLKKLGDIFNKNWELALAGYNGGPNYMKRQMKSQGTRNFWKLKLRKETHEFVPKFLAMLKVARKKYPEMYFQGAPRAWASSS
jgi:soluble lytic murein transglycosylase-like protein